MLLMWGWKKQNERERKKSLLVYNTSKLVADIWERMWKAKVKSCTCVNFKAADVGKRMVRGQSILTLSKG